ncbi:hypothetical protein ACFQ0X_11660 [Streptomyces rectiviolaceus]|uniref:hypothetical protein n=1 Tax=Streptomyces rectiviolaceus TaxID=332591 RepID=UPI00363F1B20
MANSSLLGDVLKKYREFMEAAVITGPTVGMPRLVSSATASRVSVVLLGMPVTPTSGASLSLVISASRSTTGFHSLRCLPSGAKSSW